MTRRSRQREAERGNSESVREGDGDEIDPADLKRTPEGELIHEPTGLILEEDNIDPGPEWRAFNHSERPAVASGRQLRSSLLTND